MGGKSLAFCPPAVPKHIFCRLKPVDGSANRLPDQQLNSCLSTEFAVLNVATAPLKPQFRISQTFDHVRSTEATTMNFATSAVSILFLIRRNISVAVKITERNILFFAASTETYRRWGGL